MSNLLDESANAENIVAAIGNGTDSRTDVSDFAK